MSMAAELGRRRVLRGMLGGTAVTVGLPFLDCFLDGNGIALADGAPLPTIFANWFFGCGLNPGRWEPKTAGKLVDLGPELEPLRPYMSKVNVFSGFKVPLDGKPAQPHITGKIAVQTGIVAAAGQKAALPSIDTIIADTIGTKTRFRSLEVSCIGSRNSESVRAGNIMNPSEVSPTALYTRIFGPDFRDPNAADFTPDPRVMARQSVLSGVKDQLVDLQGMLGAADKVRLDEYLTSVRQLEQQLALELQKPEPLKACTAPQKPVGELPPNAEVTTMQTNHRLFVQLIANALACGQTRVANIALTEGLSTLRRSGNAVIHHTHTHEEPVDPKLGYQPNVTWFIGTIMSAMVDMIATFDGFREGDRSLLDRMLVWVSTETGYAKVHSTDNIPTLTVGGANGRVKTGLHIPTAGDPISRVGLTVQQAMGVPVNSWGSDTMATSRTITEILRSAAGQGNPLMRPKLLIVAGLVLVAVVAAYFLAGRPAATARLDAPLATPLGITLHNTVEQKPVPYNLLNIVKGPYRFGDAKGMTAYFTDSDAVPGKSTCEGDCAVAWPPVVAPAGAKADGDWTIVARSDGTRQWAYRGKPLYSSTKDKNWGQLKGDRTDGVWHVAAPVWNNGAPMPPEIAVHEVAEALGQSLVDDRGMALYTGPAIGSDLAETCDAPCMYSFRPYEAPQIALPVGDFAAVDRADGIRQWVYKGLPLYTYDGDVRLGDANGVDKRFKIALVARYFVPKEAVLRPDEKMGGIWTTEAGKTFYIRDLLHYTASGAHSARGGDPGLPQLGRTVGLMGCDSACEATHPPLIAPTGSQPSGYWTIYERSDGRLQWAYAGYPLYASAADTKPGDLHGNDDYDVLRVETAALRTALDPFGPGLFWHAANP